jgi:energy-converting hydrogenase Eha subunit H
MMLCVAAIAVTNSSMHFNVFEFTLFMLLWNLLVLSLISLKLRSAVKRKTEKGFPRGGYLWNRKEIG